MSSKKRSELLVRVRFSNPLPPPPCPPKMLKIPTDSSRYARPEFSSGLANAAPLPMVVDAECGMPLDLSKMPEFWDDSPEAAAYLDPDPINLPELHPDDILLLADGGPSSGATLNGHLPSGSASQSSAPVAVPWLRRTEYISREGTQHLTASPEVKQHDDTNIDVSRTAQIADIETSFQSANLADLQHPTKPGITAVEAFEVLPDEDVWANAYMLFRFSERPGNSTLTSEDKRVDCAIMRPIESEGEHFLAYFLSKSEEDAQSVMNQRGVTGVDPSKVTQFHFVRDYETVKVDQDVAKEFLLVLDDGTKTEFDESVLGSTRRPKGAYYKNIDRRITLKKRRVKPSQQLAYSDKWDVINMNHVALQESELGERQATTAEVTDPDCIFYVAEDADADGDINVGGSNADLPAANGDIQESKPEVSVNGSVMESDSEAE